MKKLLIILYLLLSQSVWATTTPDSKQIDVLKQKLQTCYNQFNNPKHQACLQTLTNCLQDDEHITQAHTCFIDVAEELTSLYLPDYTTIKQDLTTQYQTYSLRVKKLYQEKQSPVNSDEPMTPNDMFRATKLMYQEVDSLFDALPIIQKIKQNPDLIKENTFVNPLFHLTMYPFLTTKWEIRLSSDTISTTDHQSFYNYACELIENNLLSIQYKCKQEIFTKDSQMIEDLYNRESFHQFSLLFSGWKNKEDKTFLISHIKWDDRVILWPRVIYVDKFTTD
ncbi:MAG: hypothetical protein IJ440_01575 [Alphaproteobacteria bacterium]|nr:hypothetical protein [Alphaproteobacteria bacterium]